MRKTKLTLVTLLMFVSVIGLAFAVFVFGGSTSDDTAIGVTVAGYSEIGSISFDTTEATGLFVDHPSYWNEGDNVLTIGIKYVPEGAVPDSLELLIEIELGDLEDYFTVETTGTAAAFVGAAASWTTAATDLKLVITFVWHTLPTDKLEWDAMNTALNGIDIEIVAKITLA